MNTEPVKWKTSDGREIAVSDMETDHIRRALTMLTKQCTVVAPPVVLQYPHPFIAIFQAELARRARRVGHMDGRRNVRTWDADAEVVEGDYRFAGGAVMTLEWRTITDTEDLYFRCMCQNGESLESAFRPDGRRVGHVVTSHYDARNYMCSESDAVATVYSAYVVDSITGVFRGKSDARAVVEQSDWRSLEPPAPAPNMVECIGPDGEPTFREVDHVSLDSRHVFPRLFEREMVFHVLGDHRPRIARGPR